MASTFKGLGFGVPRCNICICVISYIYIYVEMYAMYCCFYWSAGNVNTITTSVLAEAVLYLIRAGLHSSVLMRGEGVPKIDPMEIEVETWRLQGFSLKDTIQ